MDENKITWYMDEKENSQFLCANLSPFICEIETVFPGNPEMEIPRIYQFVITQIVDKSVRMISTTGRGQNLEELKTFCESALRQMVIDLNQLKSKIIRPDGNFKKGFRIQR